MNNWWAIIIIFIALTLETQAWIIGTKGRSNGPGIHTTYFNTPQNAPVDVQHTKLYVGKLVNGVCVYNKIYDIGSDKLQTGDYVVIDAFALKSLIGGGYSCMTFYYTYKILVQETVQLIFDGFNYTGTIPRFRSILLQ